MSEEKEETKVIKTEDGTEAVIGGVLDAKVTKEYDDSEIQVLDGLENVLCL